MIAWMWGKQEPVFTAGKSAKAATMEISVDISQKAKNNLRTIQLYSLSIHTKNSISTTETLAPCLLLLCSLYPVNRNSLDAQMNG